MLRYLVLLLLLQANCAIGQDFNNYQPLRSRGDVPQRFLKTSAEKFQQDVEQQLSSVHNHQEAKAKKKFYLESNFMIDRMLLGGRVLYNDPISAYCSKVLDELLKNDQELRKQIEVYAIKSTSVNAFTTDNGLVLVTIGLLAQLENEAQLAFILAHEISHYIKKHAINGYIEKENILKGKGIYRQSSMEEKLMARSSYSKNNEKEADAEGLKMYLKTNYDVETTLDVFDVLRYAHLPFDLVAFEKSFLETENLIFPENYWLKEVAEIKGDDDEEEYATHPGALSRKEETREAIKNVDNKGKKIFIISEDEFLKVQKISRFELANIHLQNEQYEESFYTSYMLLKDYPENLYLKKIILSSLYGLAKFGNRNKFNNVHTDYDEVQGEPQKIYYLFEQMSDKEFHVVATTYAWNLRRQNPEDENIIAISEDLLKELFTYYNPGKNYYLKKGRETKLYSDTMPSDTTILVEENIVENNNTSLTKQNKYDKIRKEKGITKETPENIVSAKWHQYAFVELWDFKEFADAYEKNVPETSDYTIYFDTESHGNNLKANTKPVALGIDNVVFVSPFYYKFNDKYNSTTYKYIASEEAQNNLRKVIEDNAKRTGLSCRVVNREELEKQGTEAFNDMVVFQEMVENALDLQKYNFVNITTPETKELAKKYNTPYFCWTGVVAVKKGAGTNIISRFPTLAFYPFTPYFFYRLIKPQNHTTYITLVMNVETGTIEHLFYTRTPYNDKSDMLNSKIYDVLSQIKKKNKKKS